MRRMNTDRRSREVAPRLMIRAASPFAFIRVHLRLIFFCLAALLAASAPGHPMQRHTTVEIRGDRFFINGKPTYEGRSFDGKRVEGLLMNSRMVQGIFDDRNPETVGRWAYPDTGKWDAERNTREFLAAMP